MVAYTYSGIVHDGGMRHIYIFRSASGGLGLPYEMALGIGMISAGILTLLFTRMLRPVIAR